MSADHSTGPPVHVLHLLKGLGPGGAERLVATFAARSDPTRVRTSVAYLLPGKDHLVDELRSHGAAVTCLEARHPGDLRWLARLVRLVRRARPAVVHVHSPAVAALARPVLRALPGLSVVGTEHNDWASHHPVTRAANRATVGLEHATFAVSEEVRHSMGARACSRAQLLEHGVDVDGIGARRGERATHRTELGIGPSELLVATVANLRATKDLPTLLHAAASVRAEAPQVRFAIAGQGPLAEELAALHRSLELGDGLRLLGYQADPIALLTAADGFCLSSRHEGLPIALLEALAAGLPVVTTAVGGVPSVVRDDVEGRLVPPGDPAALARGLLELTDPATRHRWAATAARRATSYGAGPAVEHLTQVYERLAAVRS